jgi:hypothetical protein
MNIHDAYPSSYMNGKNTESGTSLVIREVKEETVGKDNVTRPVLHWSDTEQLPLVLNKTNAMTLADMFGKETDTWRGCQVQVNVEKVAYMGEVHDAVRLAPALQQAEAELAF